MFLDYLGIGVYSEVLKVKNSFTEEDYVIKIVKKEYLVRDDRNMLRSILDRLSVNEHKNITEFIELFQDKKYYYLVYQYNNGGMM